MNRVLSLDLGTASIGWLIRKKAAQPSFEDILASGVVIFPEGFGSEKGNIFSLAAKRREKRLIRRPYYRRKLRKYAVLSILINNNMVPLTREELRAWIKPDKGCKAKYPGSKEFHRWLRLTSINSSTSFANIYELRKAGIYTKLGQYEGQGFTINQLVGRIIYNYAQRRGFESNAKYKKDDDSGKVKEAISTLEQELNGRYLAEYFADINPFEGRIRTRYISRKMYKDEFEAVCNAYSSLLKPVKDQLEKVLFKSRPLKSQKENVGCCSLEKGKKRIHLSHPDFEIFRLMQFLQNIRFEVPTNVMAPETVKLAEEEHAAGSGYSRNGSKTIRTLDIENQKNLVARIISETRDNFSKKELEGWISEELGTKVTITSKYNSESKFPARACPTSYILRKVLGPEWRNNDYKPFSRTYQKGEKGKHTAKIGWEEIWHFITEADERPEKFSSEQPVFNYALSIGMSEEQAKLLNDFSPALGYASLSQFAIKKILPFMEQGYPYHLAVLLAGMKRVLGEKTWMQEGQVIIEDLRERMNGLDLEISKCKVFNDLLGQLRATGEVAEEKEIKKKLRFYLGSNAWKNESEMDQDFPGNVISDLKTWIDHAIKNPENAAFKPAPSLKEIVKDRVKDELNARSEKHVERKLEQLYHHSAISKWKPAEWIKQIDPVSGEERIYPKLQTPYTGAIQNPAAMRTLHEVRKLVNYLLEKGLLDEHDSVVVEMARELNDSNMRRAITEWQRIQENERMKIREFLVEQMNQQNPSEDQIQKTRLWLEQIQHAEGEIGRDFLDKQLLGKELRGKKSDSIVTKLQLWKEQNGICLYYGKQLSISDVLFGESEIEHTIPRSLSNDTRMENLTLATTTANRQKKNQLPAQLTEQKNGIDPIEKIQVRLRPWEARIEDLTAQIKRTSARVKARKASGDIEGYNQAVKDRWLLRFELRYWRDKVGRFYMDEVDAGFALRQLIDTQVIAKYATGWLKTVFKHVRGTKGSLTATLRKEWQLQAEYELKDRTNHTHHLIDAAVNAFVEPGLYNRLSHFYRNKEEGKKVHLPMPWKGFANDIKKLCDNTLIYHVYRDRTKVQTKKRKKDGSFERGRGVRARLHMETALANVRTWDYDDEGKLKWKLNQEGEHETAYATRKDVNPKDQPVFPELKKYIKNREDLLKTEEKKLMPVYKLMMNDGKKRLIKDLNNESIKSLVPNDLNRHFLNELEKRGLENIKREGFFIPMKKIRILKAATQPPKVRTIQQAFQHPDRPHKHHMYYENEGNYGLAIYKNQDGKKEKRTFIIASNLDAASKTDEELFPSTIDDGKLMYQLEGAGHGKQIFKIGLRILLFEENPEEIWDDPIGLNIWHRLYVINGIANKRVKRPKKVDEYGAISMIHHSQTGKIRGKNGTIEDQSILTGKFQQYEPIKPVRFLYHTQVNALIENIDFIIGKSKGA